MTFPQFARFPSEIRCMVWELYLPTRIIPMSVMHVAFTSYQRASDGGVKPAVKEMLRKFMPTSSHISKVCRESYALAHSCHRRAEDCSMPWLGEKTWFDPRTDTIFIDCDIFRGYHEVWKAVQRGLLLPSAARGQRFQIAVSSNLAKRIGPGLELPKLQDDDGDGGIVRSGPLAVVMDRVSLFLTKDEAAALGLFGPSVEHSIPKTLVDVCGDSRQLGRLASVTERVMDGRKIETIVERVSKDWKKCVDQWPTPPRSESDLPEGREDDLARLLRWFLGSACWVPSSDVVRPMIHVQGSILG
ncbi:hypothetical protein C8A03DRAFT_19228 [Achaetomium macrosporum]|uniref:2EXR domain-containing protein n=1 Tax=Achaetomium macrosporum TaxID=79813 RepID=A0AAN7C1R1_9PEZI|nr:hypothetical protein C8A03DRAFT_19228 [Achaetomium macrosporum]